MLKRELRLFCAVCPFQVDCAYFEAGVADTNFGGKKKTRRNTNRIASNNSYKLIIIFWRSREA